MTAWDNIMGSAVNSSGEQLIWMEENESMKLKIDLIREYDLAGVACWKLGFETPEYGTLCPR